MHFTVRSWEALGFIPSSFVVSQFLDVPHYSGNMCLWLARLRMKIDIMKIYDIQMRMYAYVCI